MLRKIVLIEVGIGAANESVAVVCGWLLPRWGEASRGPLLAGQCEVWCGWWLVTARCVPEVDLAQSRLVQHRSLTVTELTHDFFSDLSLCGVQLAALFEFWCVPTACTFSNPGYSFPPVRRVVLHTGAVAGGWVTALPVLHFLPHVTTVSVDPNG